MILFDYGQTLIVEPQFDWMAANLAILAHVIKINFTRIRYRINHIIIIF